MWFLWKENWELEEINEKIKLSKVKITIRQPFTIDKTFLKENKDTGYQDLAEEVLYKIYKGDEN